MKTKLENYKFKCYYDHCEKAYLTKYHLRRHINSTHLNIKTFTCPGCSKSFSSKQNFKEHMQLQCGHKTSIGDKEVKIEAELAVLNKLPLMARLSQIFSQGETMSFSKAKNNSNRPMPVLPPIDGDRQSVWGNAKIPILPILLN
mmetsp:Transcript_5149/g.5105  ORF Transcript_5149/g.5105 Transcript_5149/m.5105 type:complete len:144 (-) Transcript_5149:43-474(-)